MSIVGMDTTVKKVTILKPGNDLDYEFYDDYFYSPETKYVKLVVCDLANLCHRY